MIPALSASPSQTPLSILENSQAMTSSAVELATMARHRYTFHMSDYECEDASAIADHRLEERFWQATDKYAQNLYTLLSHEANPSAEKTQDYVKAALEIFSRALVVQQLPSHWKSLQVQDLYRGLWIREIKQFVRQQPLNEITVESVTAEIIRLRLVFPDAGTSSLVNYFCFELEGRRALDWKPQVELNPERIEVAVREQPASLEAERVV